MTVITSRLAQHSEHQKPTPSHRVTRYQLRDLKESYMPLEEFITKAWLLVGDGSYHATINNDTLREPPNIWS